MTQHRFRVDRKILVDEGGRMTLSAYWRILCRDCDWRGTRIERPGREESMSRVEEWNAHVRGKRVDR